MRALAIIVVTGLAMAAPARAQTPAGDQIFQARCATCHTGQPDSRAPSPEALKSRTTQAVIDALVNGGMRVQGSQMSGAERRAVAEFLTGKKVEDDVTGAAAGRCTTKTALANVERGPRWTSWSPSALYPDGRQEIVLRVPKYDFGWQTDYALAQPLSLPKGSKLHVTAHYDNSSANRSNPDPTSIVRWGDQTWEEMMIGYITYSVDSAQVNVGTSSQARARPTRSSPSRTTLTSSLSGRQCIVYSVTKNNRKRYPRMTGYTSSVTATARASAANAPSPYARRTAT